MKIGITYDLKSDYLKKGFSDYDIAELDNESTIEHIETALQSLGYKTDRIGHLENLMQKLLKHKKWDLVFNICEGMYGSGREAQVPALLDAFQIPYTFSDPLVLALTLNKALTKRIIRDFKIPTSRFCVIKDESDLGLTNYLEYPLFVKPNAEGSGKGIDINSKVNNSKELINVCNSIWTISPCELIAEEYLPGKEFTVGIIGTGKESEVLGCMEVNFNSDEKFYSYNMKTNYEENITYTLAKKEVSDKVCKLALESWRVLGCRDAGRVDIRLDRYGEPNFIEVNPLAGLNKETSDLPILARMNEFSYEYLIEQIIESAKKRIK